MRRELSGKWVWIVRGIAIALALFHIYTAGTIPLATIQQRAVHVALGYTLILAGWSPWKKEKTESKIPIYDVLLIALIFACSINAFIKMNFWFTHIMYTTNFDLVLGSCAVILSVEAARRTTGWVFPGLVIAFLLYALLGFVITGKFGHPGQSWSDLIVYLYQTDFGIWGFITGISATIVAMFLIFGAFLLFTGGGASFIDIAIKIAGKIRGGPALVAVVGSGLFGTISGSAVANVATTGNFTIPLMKSLGYKPEFAGGVESTASTGGQLAPPIMGAGAFVMAELVGVSYLSVVIAAIIPAILYYAAVFSGVLFEARRINLAPMPREQILPWGQIVTWQKLAPLILPVGAIFYFIIAGYSICRACFWAIVVAVVIYAFANFRWQDIKQRLRNIVYALERGGMAITEVVALLVCANVVIAIMTQTGLNVKLTEFIMAAAGQSLLLAMVLTAVCALILGMGMTTTAAYVLGAAILAPALSTLGMIELQGHLFIFYFCILSAITPPVCLAVYAAAGIAKAPWLPIAWVALRLALVAYFLPFAFAYEPALIAMGSASNIALCSCTALAGCVSLAAALFGCFISPLNIPARIFAGSAAVMFLIPGVSTDILALPILALAAASQIFIPRLAARRANKP